MTPPHKPFRIPQDPFLSRDFLSYRTLQPALPKTLDGRRRYYTFWARNALYHSLRVAGLSPGDEVLIPAYICKVVPEAVQSYGAKVLFHQVRKDCQPDFADIEAKLSARTRALVAVHYFGFPQPISHLVDFCKRHGLFLIEDCAHVLQSEVAGRLLGNFGDAGIFSLRKFYPVYDGGVLLLNSRDAELRVDWSSESLVFSLRVAKDLLDQLAANSSGSFLSFADQAMRAFKKPLIAMITSSANASAMKTEKTDAAFNPKVVNLPMSRLSRKIYEHSDMSAIVAKRRTNYLFLQKELAGLAGLQPLIEQLPSGICPWVFPVFFGQGLQACAELRAMGIPAVTWDGVRPGGLDTPLFPDAEFLYRNLVFLPVHQNLNEEDLRKIVQAVRQLPKQEHSLDSGPPSRPVGGTG